MTDGEHLTVFADLPVADFGPGTLADDLPDAAEVAWRIRTELGGPGWAEVFERFLERVDTARVSALVLGYWACPIDGSHPVDLLLQARERFPSLRALFIGDVSYEEDTISWIEHTDLTLLLQELSQLETLEIRGTRGLWFEPLASGLLRRLRIESSGLPGELVDVVAASDLPNLEHLDLWLGAAFSGGDATVSDLAPILSGERFPALRHLGLENSEFQDEIAAAVANAPVVARLESLSLAMGVLTDTGAEALLSGQPPAHLRRLDLHHHFLTDAMVERLRTALPGVETDVDDGRLVMVSPADEWQDNLGAYVMVPE
ncbi:STM4015 family protein [Actinomadura macrotermitis]|uniref:Leucine-rich repeat domain-containing protein n=1 Tax=Actinomadura macrotermitis TaxID=2585200 RepID=A0A7K0C4C9_9ACTN|nr:STM4015 family protein [Actinomadura macrotermitis]MQY08295.1 hypothetical protein [Actinomadura macrotermitis]